MSNKQILYKTYSFEHEGNIMFFYYNSNHPIMMKSIKFQLGKIKIYASDGKVYSCLITSNPHLNVVLDWNQQYFGKLFHGLSLFELEASPDPDDDALSLIVKDHFEANQEIFLMRAKLTQEFGYDITDDFWKTFARFNEEKIKNIESLAQENRQLRKCADNELVELIRFQEEKQMQKDILKGQLSVLLRQKQAKLKEFNQNFVYHGMKSQIQPSMDLTAQKQSLSIAGSLFEESQDFNYQQ